MLFYVCFLFLFILFNDYLKFHGSPASGRHAFLYAWLSLSLIVWFSTETLSTANLITPKVIYSVWGTVLLALIPMFFVFYRKAGKFYEKWPFRPLSLLLRKDNDSLLVIALSSFFIILPLLVLAIFYPPNNWDSMTYHLPRVEHWIQNKNLMSYPTSNPRQLFSQPFAEYFILHFRLLTGDDYLSNTVQFVSMLGSVITVSLVIRCLGGSGKWQLLGSVICLTLPTGISESVTTQNDYLASFYSVTFLYFCLRYLLNEPTITWRNITILALPLGFGVLTKIHISLFLLPVCLWCGSVILTRNYKNFFMVLFLGSTIVFLINSPFYYRNYMTTGNLIGDEKIASWMSNEEPGVRSAISNTIKNASLSFVLPLNTYNEALHKIVVQFHEKILQYDVNSNNFLPERGYYLHWEYDEDNIGSFFLFAFYLLMSCYVLSTIFGKRRLPSQLYILYFTSVLGMLFYSSLFRWQEWGNRLLLPWFVSLIPVVVLVFQDIVVGRRDYLKLFFLDKVLIISLIVFVTTAFLLFTTPMALIWVPLSLLTTLAIYWLRKKGSILLSLPTLLSLVLLFSGIFFVFHAPARPFIQLLTERNDFTRMSKASSLSSENLAKLKNVVGRNGVKSLALDIGQDTWEYPIWRVLRQEGVHISHSFMTTPPISKVHYKSWNETRVHYDALLTEFPEQTETINGIAKIVPLHNNYRGKTWALYLFDNTDKEESNHTALSSMSMGT